MKNDAASPFRAGGDPASVRCGKEYQSYITFLGGFGRRILNAKFMKDLPPPILREERDSYTQFTMREKVLKNEPFWPFVDIGRIEAT